MAKKIEDISPEYIEENYRLVRLGLAAGCRDLMDGKVNGKVFLDSMKTLVSFLEQTRAEEQLMKVNWKDVIEKIEIQPSDSDEDIEEA